jgi:hypothetical protein
MMRTIRCCLLLLALLLPSAAFAQEQTFTNRDTDLKERADAGAATLAPLPANTAVKVLARAGAWTQVQAGGKTGFVRVFHLRFPATVEGSSSSSGSNPFAALGGLIGGNKPDERAKLASTGVRGLSKEDVKNANPDARALAKMQSYRADKAEAQRFAREGKLAEKRVDDPEGKAAR